MWWSILIFLSFGFLYFLQDRYYKRVYQEILLYVAIALLMVNFLSRKDISEPFSPIEALIAISIVLTLSFLFYIFSRKKVNKVIAKQVSYWDVPFELILSKNKHNITSKKDRNELTEQSKEYFYEEIFEEDKKIRKIQPLILSDIKKYRGFTLVKSLNYFKRSTSSVLHTTIYKKLESINDKIEADLDFEELLEENQYCVEFFLINIWEVISSKEIIGIGTLKAYANNKKELELIGALDAAMSSNVRKQGILLYSHYLNFKGLKDYVK